MARHFMPPFRATNRNPVLTTGFLRCDYCGSTYRDDRECCPHCLAPRPEQGDEQQATDTVLYADGIPYLRIGRPKVPEPYGTVGRC